MQSGAAHQMSNDPRYGRHCDECGRDLVKAVRIHLEKEYCAACYKRTFVKAQCVTCQQSMRAHRHASEEPVCDSCIRGKRTCMRCDKPVPQAAKLVGKRAVCNTCAPYFRERRHCANCGKLSFRVSASLSSGIEGQICDSCRTATKAPTNAPIYRSDFV